MQPNSDRQSLLAEIGPTATGKTDLAIQIALEHRGEIVNADSRLMYRGMDIGTAKPTPVERARVPHHLIDLIPPTQSYNLSEFLTDARSAIREISRRKSLPILVGGSGQYVWALLEGWNVPPIPLNQELRAELEQTLADDGLATLQSRLLSLDADAEAKVDFQNPRRVLRAIERATATGDATGGATKAERPPYDALIIGLTASRDHLQQRIILRIDAMLNAGWLDEVRTLASQGLTVTSQSMYSIGYREMLRHVNGEINLTEAKDATVKTTMRLVDAQENWFKKSDQRITWFDIADPDYATLARESVREWLRTGHRGPANR